MKGFIVTRSFIHSYVSDDGTSHDGHGGKQDTIKVSAVICELCVLLYVPSACDVAPIKATKPDAHALDPIGKCARCGQQLFDDSLPLPPSFVENLKRRGL